MKSVNPEKTLKRVVMAVDQFYKHDGQDETYAYGYDMLTQEAIRIRMGSSEEFSKVINKLNRNHQSEEVSIEDVNQKFDSGRNQRTSIDTHDRGNNRGRILCFDKCELEQSESLGNYKSYVSQWCNVMSNNPSSQLIKAMASINVHQRNNGDFFVKAQIVESAQHLQVPHPTKQSPALYNAVLKENLKALIKGLSNATDYQPERVPFTKLVVRYSNGSSFTNVPLMPTYEDAQRESVKQMNKPDPMMQSGGVDKTKKNYLVAKSSVDSMSDILNGDDYHTATYNPKLVTNTPAEKVAQERKAHNVFVMDQARIAMFALLGDRNIKIFFNADVDQEKNKELKRLYAGLVKGDLKTEIYVGQQLQLGALYKDAFLKKYFNNKTPHAGFRKVDPTIDLRMGTGVRGLDQPPLVNHFTDPNGNPKQHDLNQQFLSQVHPETMNKLTHAKQHFAEAYLVVQPHQRNSNNCFISFIEPVELTQTRMNGMEMSALTVEHINERQATIDSPLSNTFDYERLQDPRVLMEEVRKQYSTENDRSIQLEQAAPRVAAPTTPSLS